MFSLNSKACQWKWFNRQWVLYEDVEGMISVNEDGVIDFSVQFDFGTHKLIAADSQLVKERKVKINWEELMLEFDNEVLIGGG